MTKFRFEDSRIWQASIQITDELLDLANTLEKKRLYRFSEQLRAAALSISNDIAEGSGSSSKKDFANILSLFEVANILIVLNRRKIISNEVLSVTLNELDSLSRQITSFKRSLFK